MEPTRRVVSDSGPLEHLESEDRVTGSGIALPVPDPDKGAPVIVLQTSTAALVYNVAGPEPEDLVAVAAAIHAAQEQLAHGDVPAGLWFREPQYGQDFYLSPRGIESIVGICRGFAKITDPFSAPSRSVRPRILSPSL